MVMMRPKSARTADPNLTPILDMVFQLITFFMLVVSFKTASMDPGIRLPVIGTARPCAPEADQHFVVLNIDASGTLRVYGVVYDLEHYLAKEASAIRQAASKSGQQVESDDFRMATVIRADKSTPFGQLNRVLAACKKYGFVNVTLKVLGNESGAQPDDISL